MWTASVGPQCPSPDWVWPVGAPIGDWRGGREEGQGLSPLAPPCESTSVSPSGAWGGCGPHSSPGLLLWPWGPPAAALVNRPSSALKSSHVSIFSLRTLMGTDLLANAVCQRCTCLVPPPQKTPCPGDPVPSVAGGSTRALRAAGITGLPARGWGDPHGCVCAALGVLAIPAGSRRATGAGPPPGLNSGHPPENPQRGPWQESGLQGRQVLLLHPKLARLCRAGLQSGHTRVWARNGALLEQMCGLDPDRQRASPPSLRPLSMLHVRPPPPSLRPLS